MILPFRMGPAASRSVLCDIDRVILGVAKKLGTSCTNKICRYPGFLDFHCNRNNFVRTFHFFDNGFSKNDYRYHTVRVR